MIQPTGGTASNNLSDFIGPETTDCLQDKIGEHSKIIDNVKDESNWSLLRIIIGIIDLLLLLATITTFLLYSHKRRISIRQFLVIPTNQMHFRKQGLAISRRRLACWWNSPQSPRTSFHSEPRITKK